jgi:hypothetical protein
LKKPWFRRNRDQIIISIIGSISSTILIALLFGAPQYVIEHWSYLKGVYAHWIKEPIRVDIIRSLVNHQFVLTKNLDGSIKEFKVSGSATTFQIKLRLTNNYEQPMLISSLLIYGRNSSEKITSTRPEITLAPLESKEFDFPQVQLFGIQDTLIIPALLSGSLGLDVTTEYGVKSLELNCVCFSGLIQPVNDHLFIVGKDSSCLKYEMENPDGVYKQTNGFTKF